MAEPGFEVVSPLGPPRRDVVAAANGLGDLAGARLGFVWDSLFSGDLLFETIAAELAARFEGIEFVGYEAFGDIHGADEKRVLAELPARLTEHRIDGLIVGVGA